MTEPTRTARGGNDKTGYWYGNMHRRDFTGVAGICLSHTHCCLRMWDTQRSQRFNLIRRRAELLAALE